MFGEPLVGHGELHVLGAIHGHGVPEGEQRLLIGVHCHRRLRDGRVVQLPQVREVLPELPNRITSYHNTSGYSMKLPY